jgi:hypothetical protein
VDIKDGEKLKTKELFQYFKNELNKLNDNIEYKEIISNVDTKEEEFYFFIQYNFNVCFYVFYDDWGMGLGINYKIKNKSNIWYFEDIGVLEEKKQYEFMLKIMSDIVLGQKIFCEDNDGTFHIDFNCYKELKWKISYKKKDRLSIYEINERQI